MRLYGKHRICRRSGLCRFCEFHTEDNWWKEHEHVMGTCTKSAYLPLTAATVTNGKVSVLHSNLSKSLKKLTLSASVKLSNSSRSSPREKCLSFPVVTIAVASWQLQHFWHTVIIYEKFGWGVCIGWVESDLAFNTVKRYNDSANTNKQHLTLTKPDLYCNNIHTSFTNNWWSHGEDLCSRPAWCHRVRVPPVPGLFFLSPFV